MKTFSSATLHCLAAAIGAMALTLPTGALAEPPTCTTEEARAALDSTSNGRSLQRIRLRFKRYANCDEGEVADKFALSISALLADHWGEVRKHEGLLVKDTAFRDFIVRHVNAGMPAERRERVAQNANERCPDRLKSFCRDVAAATSTP